MRPRAEIPVALAQAAVIFDDMDWQQLVALLIVATAAGLLLWGRLKRQRRKFDFQRDTHCGCSAPSGTASKSSIVFHARKGEPPRVLVKMK